MSGRVARANAINGASINRTRTIFTAPPFVVVCFINDQAEATGPLMHYFTFFISVHLSPLPPALIHLLRYPSQLL